MASNNSKNIDHGNYVPTPVPQRPVATAGGSSGRMAAAFVDEGKFRQVYVLAPGTGLGEVPEAFVVGAGASLEVTVVVLPGTSARIPLTVDLVGAEASASLSGTYLCSGTDEVVFDITVNHRVGNCLSRQLFNGLASDASKCAFFGKIVVAPDAQQTEAYQENHNIVLSDGARIDTKPRLEIYADDVRCSHGATVGKLDEEEQFYMRSRGIPEDEAKVLQMVSFVAPILAGLDDEALVARIESAIRSLVR